jgi:hypothetical protein
VGSPWSIFDFDCNKEVFGYDDGNSSFSEQALSFPYEDRIFLVERLLKSQNVLRREKIARAWAEKAERRINELDSGEVSPIPIVVFAPSGKILEGNGNLPDFPVVFTVSDYFYRRDHIFDKALNMTTVLHVATPGSSGPCTDFPRP